MVLLDPAFVLCEIAQASIFAPFHPWLDAKKALCETHARKGFPEITHISQHFLLHPYLSICCELHFLPVIKCRSGFSAFRREEKSEEKHIFAWISATTFWNREEMYISLFAGSTCALTESILRRRGLKTGLLTSPHLVNVNERIRINGKPINQVISINRLLN